MNNKTLSCALAIALSTGFNPSIFAAQTTAVPAAIEHFDKKGKPPSTYTVEFQKRCAQHAFCRQARF